MDLATARKIATNAMEYHGLSDWHLAWDRAVRRGGVCKYSRRTLSFSIPILTHNDEESFTDTVLHEIAHALVGPGHGHDNVWKRKAREIGANPSRCMDTATVTPEAPWTGVHDGCDITYPRHRVPKGSARYCPKCYVAPKRRSTRLTLDDMMSGMVAPLPDNSRAEIRWVRTSTLAKA